LSRSHVLGLRLRKVAQQIFLFLDGRPLGAKEINVLGLRLRKVAHQMFLFLDGRPLGAKENQVSISPL